MAEFIPSYTLSAFRKLSGEQIKQLKSCEITLDGEYLFTFINPTSDYIKLSAEQFGGLANSIGLKTMEEVLNPKPATPAADEVATQTEITQEHEVATV